MLTYPQVASSTAASGARNIAKNEAKIILAPNTVPWWEWAISRCKTVLDAIITIIAPKPKNIKKTGANNIFDKNIKNLYVIAQLVIS